METLKWSDIEARFQALLPREYVQFEALFKGTDTPFYQARYPFGAEILQKDQFCLITEGIVETHISLPNHLIPLAILKPGSFINFNVISGYS